MYSYHNKSKDFKYIKKYKNINEWIFNEINPKTIPMPGSYNVNYTSQAAPMNSWLNNIPNLKNSEDIDGDINPVKRLGQPTSE